MAVQHIARYHFALNYSAGKTVLDFGCGEGFGTELLMSSAATVIALDVSKEAVAISAPKIDHRLTVADGRKAPFKSNSFNVITSFEVFEHITNVEDYVAEAYRLLKVGGLFIMSTPNVDSYPLAGLNPYHVKEYTVDEVTEILSGAGFKNQRIFAQIAANEGISRLENSRLLLLLMKLKRKFGFHGDLLPRSFQRIIHKKIAKSDPAHFNPEDFLFIEGRTEEPELIYISQKIEPSS